MVVLPRLYNSKPRIAESVLMYDRYLRDVAVVGPCIAEYSGNPDRN